MRFSAYDWGVVARDTGAILRYAAPAFLVPILVLLLYAEPLSGAVAFAAPAVVSFVIGTLLVKGLAGYAQTRTRHALVTIALLWIIFSLLAALPFALLGEMGYRDAVFESMSALTTTGLSMAHTDALSKASIFWRSIQAWVGGLGFIVIVAVGIIGRTRASKLMIAEGREQHLKPNLKNAAKELLATYAALTAIGVVLLALTGIGAFDSINLAMSAISTTGMPPSDTLLPQAGDATLYALVIILLLGATSLTTHHLFWRKRKRSAYAKDVEFKLLLVITALCTLAAFAKLGTFYGTDALVHALVYSTGAATNGGFDTLPFGALAAFPGAVLALLFAAMFIGGSTGGTAGGIKIYRAWLVLKSAWWNAKELVWEKTLHVARRVEHEVVEEKEVSAVHAFVAFYAMFILAGAILLTMALPVGLGEALFEVTSAQSNAGLSTGITQAGMSAWAQLVLYLNMWLGRLEIIPILALCGALFARR